jgi:hypothetical protein
VTEEREPVALFAVADSGALTPRQSVSTDERVHRRVLWVLSIALVLACTSIVYLLRSFRFHMDASQSYVARHPLWKSFFSTHHPTLVICSDTGLTILENLTGNDVNLADYLSGDYRTHMGQPVGASMQTAQILAEHRYTSIVDTEIVSQLYRLEGS